MRTRGPPSLILLLRGPTRSDVPLGAHDQSSHDTAFPPQCAPQSERILRECQTTIRPANAVKAAKRAVAGKKAMDEADRIKIASRDHGQDNKDLSPFR
jgi:hypothetical protein